MTGSDRRILAGILSVALLLRLAFALGWTAPLAGDAQDYDRLARGLADGRGYVDTNGAPTAFRPPLYPAFLAGLYRTVGAGDAAVGIAQALVGTAAVAALWALARATLGSPAALVAAGLAAVDLAQLALASRRLSEGPFTLILLLLLLATVRALERLRAGRSGLGWAVAAGALGAVATLTRGLFIGLPLLLAAAFGWEGRRDPRIGARRAAAAALALLAAYGVALIPWTLRNQTALGEPVPVATQGGITLYSSWFPPDGTIFGVFPDDEVVRASVGMSEVDQNRHFVDATKRGLAAEPGRIPRLLLLKMLYLVVPLDWEVLPRYGGVNATYLVVAGWAAAFLLVLSAGRRAATWPIWLPLAYLVPVALVFYGSPRLRAPLDPLLAALAAGAMVELARRRGARAAAGAVAGSAAAALALTVWAAPLKSAALGALRATGVWRR